MVPRFQSRFGGWAGSFFLVAIVCWNLLEAGPCLMSELLTGPAEWPPALHSLHHLLVLIFEYVWDGLEALPIHTNVEDVVPVCCPIYRS